MHEKGPSKNGPFSVFIDNVSGSLAFVNSHPGFFFPGLQNL